jgi:Cytosolic carboxypeptidase N-terminal domain
MLVRDPDSWKFSWESNKAVEPYYKPKSNDDTLQFESRFESGNLDMAIKVDSNCYKLVMQSDSNTKGNCQWFYFRVQNTRCNTRVHFEIVNYVNM